MALVWPHKQRHFALGYSIWNGNWMSINSCLAQADDECVGERWHVLGRMNRHGNPLVKCAHIDHVLFGVDPGLVERHRNRRSQTKHSCIRSRVNSYRLSRKWLEQFCQLLNLILSKDRRHSGLFRHRSLLLRERMGKIRRLLISFGKRCFPRQSWHQSFCRHRHFHTSHSTDSRPSVAFQRIQQP